MALFWIIKFIDTIHWDLELVCLDNDSFFFDLDVFSNQMFFQLTCHFKIVAIQNGSFRSYKILKKKLPICSFILIVSSILQFLLFYIIKHGGQLIHEFSKMALFLA